MINVNFFLFFILYLIFKYLNLFKVHISIILLRSKTLQKLFLNNSTSLKQPENRLGFRCIRNAVSL